MNKKLLAGLLAFVLCIQPIAVMGAETETATESAWQVLSYIYEINTEYPVLTLETAAEAAIKNSKALKTILESQEDNEDDRENLWLTLNNEAEGNLSTVLSLAQLQIAYSDSLLSLEMQKSSVKSSLKATFISILNAEKELALAKEALEFSYTELQVSQIKKQKGLITSLKLEEERISYAKESTALKEKELALEDAYFSLNEMIGEGDEARFTLELTPVYEPLEMNTTLAAHINGKISSDSNIKKYINAVSLAETKLSLFFAGSGNYDDLSEDVSDASMDLSDAKDELKKKLTDCYNDILTSEKNYDAAQRELTLAYTELKAQEARYEKGLITEYALNQTRYSVAAKESSLISQIYSHMQLLDKFSDTSLL